MMNFYYVETLRPKHENRIWQYFHIYVREEDNKYLVEFSTYSHWLDRPDMTPYTLEGLEKFAKVTEHLRILDVCYKEHQNK